VENFQFLGRSGGRSDSGPGQQAPSQRAQNRGQSPQAPQSPPSQPSQGGSDDSFGGDDIPF
jgi:hypothetical protein